MHRILMYRWKAYNYLDIRAGFEKLGWEVDELWQKLESYDVDEAFAQRLRTCISEKTYDFVFSVNYFALISDVCEEAGLPYVSWSCDNPLISMYHQSVFHDCNYIFSFDEVNCREFRNMGVSHIYHLPLAVDCARIEAILSGAEDLSLYRNEVSFVGSLYERNSYDRIEPKLPEYLRGYFDGVMRMQSDLYGSNMVREALTPEILSELSQYFTLDKSEGSFSDLGLIFETTALGFKIAQIQRKEGLMLLSRDLPVSVYSNSDTSDLIRVSFRGSLDYWTEMPKVFTGTKVNLNFTIPNISSGIPLRMWDVLGSGGFLLTNYQPENALYFEEGKDLVSFYSREDLSEKAHFYLKHDSLREKIAAHGRKTVAADHTYDRRLQQMLVILKREGVADV